MFCPNCGQERVSDATRFCSRCGYLLTGTAKLLQSGGELPDKSGASNTARRAGIRHGIFLILLGLVLFPLVGILLTFGLGMRNPWPIGVILFLFGGGGILRIAYALMFQAKHQDNLPATSQQHLPENAKLFLNESQNRDAGSEFFSAPTAGWRDESVEPRSVTENTTKLLEKDNE